MDATLSAPLACGRDPKGAVTKSMRGWREAVMKARAVMGMRGFVAMNGQTAQGKALYAKTRSFYSI